MATAAPVTRRAEAAMRVATGNVAIVTERWRDSVDILKRSECHHLQLSFLPVPDRAQAGFPDRWGPRRMERLGSMFLIPAQQWVRAQSDCKVQRAVTCQLDPAALSRWFEREPEWSDAHLAGSLNLASAPIRNLMCRIASELRHPGFGGETMVELLIAEIGIELSRHFNRVGERTSAGGLAPWRLRLIEDYLHAGTGDASLASLARLCGLSVRQMTRAYRASTGRTLGDAIAQRRIEQAQAMLAAGHSVKETAFATGFSAPTNFATAFRRATGETPKEYRQRRGG